jgi:hypothetical protein
MAGRAMMFLNEMAAAYKHREKVMMMSKDCHNIVIFNGLLLE